MAIAQEQRQQMIAGAGDPQGQQRTAARQNTTQLAQSAADIDFDTIQQELANQLSLAESFQQQAQAKFPEMQRRTEAVKSFARGQGVQNVEATRGLSQRVPGEAPSELIGASTELGRALQTGISETVEAERLAQERASRDDIVSILTSMLSLKKEQRSAEQERIDREIALRKEGYKTTTIDGETVLEPLSKDELDMRFLSGEDAVAEVINQGGSSLIRKGGSKDERFAIAESILEAGGVDQYKKRLPLRELITEKEIGDLKTQTDLNTMITQALSSFGDKSGIGTGFFAQLIPGFVAGKTTRAQRRAVESVRSTYQKLISGATVSDAEVKRLSKFLPTSGKTEKQNIEDLQKLQRDININQRIFEIGKREGLTANQAFEEYGRQIFDEFGVSFPGEEEQQEFEIMEVE